MSSATPCYWLVYTGSQCNIDRVKICPLKIQAIAHLEKYKQEYESTYDEVLILDGTVLRTKSGFSCSPQVLGKAVLVQVEE